MSNDSPPPDPRPARRRATLGGFAAILLWSATVAVARSASEAVGPLGAGAAVYAVGGAAALALSARSGRFDRMLRLPRRYLWGCGALFVGYTLLLFLALGRAAGREQALEIGLLNYLWPVLTVALAPRLQGLRAGPLLAPGLALALAGTVVALTGGAPPTPAAFAARLAANPGAYGAALLAALCWALYSNLTARWAAHRDDGAVPVFLAATALALAAAAAPTAAAAAWSRRTIAEVVLLGLATAAAYGLWDRAMRRGDAVLVATASFLAPVLATIVGCVYLGVRPGWGLAGGSLAIVLGSLLGRAGTGSPRR